MRSAIRGLVSFSLILLIIGCRSTAVPTESSTYQIKGNVVASDAAKGEVTVDTEPIPGFMDAMIMPYKLAQPGIASELHPGDHITARLQIKGSTSQLDQIVVTAQAKPDYKPAKSYNVPAPGQAVPDFKFTNQNGRTVSINQFRGKALLLTFIYTRCPLPDFCIRMSRNFADVQKQLAADPKLYRQTHLLSISFDPAYDTPQVLRSYGATYAGAGAFGHWDFAVPAATELDKVDEFFDVGASPGPNRTITHSLSTAIIAPDGKIFRWYPTNEWTPSTAVSDLKQAVETKQ